MGTPILREENALRSSNVAMFQGHLCSQEPCLNSGRCNPQLDTYECICLSGFSGTQCQNSEYHFYICMYPTACWWAAVDCDALPHFLPLSKYICKDQYVSFGCKPTANDTCSLEITLLWLCAIAVNPCNRRNCSFSLSSIIWFYSRRIQYMETFWLL